MRLTVAEANQLAVRTLMRHGMSEPHAAMVADHLVDTALCGDQFSSLPRLLAIVEELHKRPPPQPIRVMRKTDNSALIDGGDNIAYVVSMVAMDTALEICSRTGIAIVCANNTWYGGRLAYYVEYAANKGYVAVHANNAVARVAPFGGIDRILGTNPLAIAFPGADEPFVLDIGTSATASGDVVLSKAKGEPLPPGVALDAQGSPTVDPDAALAGAFLAWGGHRGSGLALAIQLLGILAGSEVAIKEIRNYGMFFLLFDPQLFMPTDEFHARLAQLRSVVHASRPAAGVARVRLPGEGSAEKRRRARTADVVELDERIYARIVQLSK